jgi:hypothetical protein
MKRAWPILALLAGCSTSPAYVPDSDDRAHLQARLREALDSPHVMGKFYAEYESGGRVLTSCRGTARGFRSGVVMIEEESKTGAPLRLLRVGDRAWIYNEGWKDSAGTGWAGLGTGFQNPFAVLAALESSSGVLVPHEQGGLACSADRSMLRPLTERAGAHPPAEAPIDGVLKSGFREGPLVTRFSAETGPSTVWIAKMDITNWGAAPPMSFDDIPAPFTPDMKAAVRKALQEEGK